MASMRKALILSSAALLASGGLVLGDTYFFGTPGTGHAATADFSYVGSQLRVVLTNVGGVPSFNTDALGALFFQLPTGVTLTPVSAALTAGSYAVNYGSPVSDIGSEWAYKGGLNYQGANAGVSAVGYGIFGRDDRFVTGNANLTGRRAPDGQGWSILGDDPVPQGNQLNRALIVDSATFLFTPSQQFALHQLADVGFQYGTSECDPFYRGQLVPEPATFALMALGIGGLGALARRRRKP